MTSNDAAGFRSGDIDAFRRLVDRWSPRLLAVALAYVDDRETAHDVVQDAWLRAWERRGRFSGRGSLFGWLITITRSVALTRLRPRAARCWTPSTGCRIVCADCRSVLGAAARIRRLGVSEAIRPGFTDAVVEACGQHGRERAVLDLDRGWRRAGRWATHVALVGATAFVASLLAGTVAQIRPGPWALALTILAGTAVAVVQHRRRGADGLPGTPS